jgi:hypothetical protein
MTSQKKIEEWTFENCIEDSRLFADSVWDNAEIAGEGLADSVKR